MLEPMFTPTMFSCGPTPMMIIIIIITCVLHYCHGYPRSEALRRLGYCSWHRGLRPCGPNAPGLVIIIIIITIISITINSRLVLLLSLL